MADSDQKPFKIVVIGGGIAGLAFAHGLERAKGAGRIAIDVKVYERRTENSSFQKYPLRISPEGREALKALLSLSDLRKLVTLSSHGITHGGVSIFTEAFSPLLSLKRYKNEQPQFVHRHILKQILSEQVNIHHGKRVVRVRDERSSSEEDRVKVVFDDGTTESADLVVGADGLGSALRAQFHPTHERVPSLPYVVVQFKLITPPSKLPQIDNTGVNVLVGKKGYSVVLVPMKGKPVPPIPTTSIDPFAESAKFQPTLAALEQPCPEYIFCAVTQPAFVQWEDMAPSAWIEKISKLLENDGADSNLVKAIVQTAMPRTVGAWQIASMDEDNPIPWKGGRVVLIGDAAHAMAPQGGIGGSLALKDAQHLIQTLLSSNELGGTAGLLDSLLPGFHKQMMKRASGHMRDAKRRLRLSQREGLGVCWQRGLLRLMNLAWPVANWVTSRGQKDVKGDGKVLKSDKKKWL